jgi:hypothetical protein
MSRHENLSVTNLEVSTVKNPAGNSLIFPGYYPVAIGITAAETDSDAEVVATISGLVATDIAFAIMNAGATAQAVKKAVCTTNTLTITLAGNGGAGTQIAYAVFRAVS